MVERWKLFCNIPHNVIPSRELRRGQVVWPLRRREQLLGLLCSWQRAAELVALLLQLELLCVVKRFG